MSNIEYTIQFHTDWHCGSGLSAGADVDALVVKDKDGLPFIPGKTIKGLVREAITEIRGFKSAVVKDGKKVIEVEADDLFLTSMGFFDKDKDVKQRGDVFFTNAELSELERTAIVSNNVARFMYRKISSTAIDENGIAVDHSLRKTEVVVPCKLEGRILNIPEGFEKEIRDALRYIKRLGQNRNRGLGRCTIEIKEGGAQ